ncbi:RTA1-domain-containing protein [Calocera cornea HHB12733]|uniref:RTA1-domain-containing protein n=1 Tax=Calocera cornea HHB12733 TaxID=1353952 RepID=A0A165JY72_9BASI|nr:RTA1-domain-containing protein [Calocera cornea HHB12733]
MSGILTAPTVVAFTVPGVATITTTLPSGFDYASATSAYASYFAAAAATLTATLPGTTSTTGAATTTTQDTGVWPYLPSFPLALIAVILYSLITLLLIGRMFHFRSWWFIALVLGGLMETLGFGARASNTLDLDNVTLYKMQMACTILAPIFTAAAEYVLLGRIMDYVGARYSLFRPALVAWIFIISDVIAFLIQVGGAGALLAKPFTGNGSTQQQLDDAENLVNLGDNILLAGLAVNLGSFVVFFMQVTWFDYKTRTQGAPNGPWRTLLSALYISSTLVLIRQIYRVIEFSQGWYGYLPTHEGYFYAFDSLVILLASAVYAWYWPNLYIPGDKHMRLSAEGEEWREMTKRERKAAGLMEGANDSVERV